MRAALAILALIAALSAAHAFGLGEGNRFGRLGAISKGPSGAVVVCTAAPNGQLDLSACSNAFYIGLII